MVAACKRFKSSLFEVESVVRVGKGEEEGGSAGWPIASCLRVHKGAVATAELTVDTAKEGEEQESLRIILGFPGDMERQTFIDYVASASPNEAQEEEDQEESKNAGAAADSDEGSEIEAEEEQEDDSDGEQVDAAHYD